MRKKANRSALLKLSDVGGSGHIEDFRGKAVIDSNGESVGYVRDTVVDSRSCLMFLLVKPQGPLGLIYSDLPVPVDLVVSFDDKAISINCSLDFVTGSPSCPSNSMGDCYWEEVCAYYGRIPSWANERSPSYFAPM
jgi:sporulation protein YlmC with PRC-barrel domain